MSVKYNANSLLINLQRSDKDTSVKEKIEKLGRKASIYTADLASAKEVKELTPRVLADGHDIVSSVTKHSLKSTDRDLRAFWSTAQVFRDGIQPMSSQMRTGMR